MKLRCNMCDYQFSPKTGKAPNKCPYCDRIGTLEKVKDMQDLINEVSEEIKQRKERE